MLHLEALHEAEVREHADGAQGRLQVRQLEVTEAEVCDLERVRRGNHGSLGRGERTQLLTEAAAAHEAFSRCSREAPCLLTYLFLIGYRLGYEMSPKSPRVSDSKSKPIALNAV